MNITDSLSVLKMEWMQNLVPQILDLVTPALTEGRRVHEGRLGVKRLISENQPLDPPERSLGGHDY